VRSKLAIVGCAQRTRDDVDYDDPNLDIWVFNESVSKPWCKRADGVFQMHLPAGWKTEINRADPHHGEWLMSGNTPTIFMLEQYPEVPKCEKYPFQEVVDALLPNFTVDSERARKDFFTSTISYAYALGIYKGYKHIETFGVELADEEEYRNQQPAAMFWNGIAIGRGITWISHSRMFDVPLYPIETFVGLDKKVFLDQMEHLKPEIERLKQEYIQVKAEADKIFANFELTGNQKEDLEKMCWKQSEMGQKFGILDGSHQECDRYFNRADAMEKATGAYVFSKHEFSRDQSAIFQQRENTILKLTEAAQKCQAIITGIEPKKFDSYRRRSFKELREAIDYYVKCAVMVGMYTGAINMDEKFKVQLEETKKEQFAASYKKTDEPEELKQAVNT
jgi:hypothetical protein